MSAVPLRVVFGLNALLFLPAGVLIYVLPSTVLGVSPLWLARVAGAVIAAWGLTLAANALRPSVPGVVGQVAGNLLIVATLVPAALRSGLPSALQTVLYSLSAVLLVLALLTLLLPRERRVHL
ncbi:hypothetical protein MF271_05505 [Deinococcus sp. KNUC1210]|uniref:hypothetical protein n=1 Tax=Deinococcus sp. KNUC1210 TaxID=2917691 RepID=UPI001EF056BA|nr:hypothetical protein [Deinococcus sp. KNUC1210]ULH16088.1 hypothetical protein MF271_05505 [Deinococcus sp. KNUC1210]